MEANWFLRPAKGRDISGVVTARSACRCFECRIAMEHDRESGYLAGYRFPPEIIHQAIWLYLPVHTQLS